jgi:hypothetical protein
MNPTRRILLRVAQREISLSITQTVVTDSEGAIRDSSGPTGADRNAPEVCPECGASWIFNFAEALKSFPIPLGQLQAAILDRRLHSHWLPDGQFWVCERSLKNMKETNL